MSDNTCQFEFDDIGSSGTIATSEQQRHLQSNRGQDATEATERAVASTSASRAAEFASLKVRLSQSLVQYPDFPTAGVMFEDIMPLFADKSTHHDLIRALIWLIEDIAYEQNVDDPQKPDVIVGLESRGFLIGPTLAYKLGCAFAPVRKQGKLPGPCETESFQKEYGADHFQMQKGAIKAGQKVFVLDDIIATGGSASAAGKLVKNMGGELVAYVFMMELDFLKGREKLDAPVYTLFSGQDEKLAGR